MIKIDQETRVALAAELADLVVQQHGQWTTVVDETGNSYNEEGQGVFNQANDGVNAILATFFGPEKVGAKEEDNTVFHEEFEVWWYSDDGDEGVEDTQIATLEEAQKYVEGLSKSGMKYKIIQLTTEEVAQ